MTEAPDYDQLYEFSCAGKPGLEVECEPIDSRDVLLGRVSGPIRLRRQNRGKRVHDFVDGADLRVLSPTAMAVLGDLQATGCELVDIESDVEALAGYKLLTVTGRCGVRDEKRARRFRRPVEIGTGHIWYTRGLYFTGDAWDGTDFATCVGFVVVTQRVVDAFADAKLTNWEARRLTEFEMMLH